MDQFGGLRRITLSDNPQIGDAGSINIAEALVDDLWIKAIDLQACGLTDASARVWLSVLAGTQVKVKPSGERANTGNRSLFVLDLRRNPEIGM
ncbi:Centrosomal protein of [Fasciolopsis buskii]|uniref:Centrosomal protein of n=1 Tax=Fasciolopsis buskii TaxID=27845 RepID=A0A8E0S427_9TREM|nr:Centrosomal protein of [Fasciolopsis buski]